MCDYWNPNNAEVALPLRLRTGCNVLSELSQQDSSLLQCLCPRLRCSSQYPGASPLCNSHQAASTILHPTLPSSTLTG